MPVAPDPSPAPALTAEQAAAVIARDEARELAELEKAWAPPRGAWGG